MILVIDVGNTNTVLGVYQDETLVHHWRLATSRQKTEDEYAMTVRSLFDHAGLQFQDIDGIVISSVVPPMMFSLEQMCKKYFHVTPMIIGPGIKTGLNIKYDNPKEVGADRIVNAVAAIELYGYPAIVVDFGTATTYCLINEKKQYAGGVIAPGIMISTEALYHRASKLPRIEIAKPKQVVGTNTIDSMQSGIFYGYVSQVDGVVKRMKAQAESEPKVIATGGLAKLIGTESETIDVIDSFLTLKGLQLIYKKNV
ncbi:type III pantothenate kinase [Halalkalibacterium halodurans]|jgi:type III pantothenate kinase|uniref:Type III pantothenate kinase n=2 Tax=Halalkalibacterium halodurans TaxID=86665 RepID=COAX_HALH5|nr:type III pantothenate kinase [Halalkalibacterium halodurans]Q9KGH5.1 RecName: Full=Type III pantothenate kinase; AltName: Full=PanK-III; AltName: Full=Pantothenic acid kinase [Halalkalibacterium halodurans C-125]MDY7220589.1 type III pantothenate kinase [Halalkalibacterium halodurans]MDY7239828.1 type III pantothenate kinase [Halalkalibacterium halodurans]MED3648140.1 type III pantothenate kinase [Halalkalibacterium halodurans]MED4125449.1 type III pantothenate kinase [Halalkalibacterium ha